jgi:hypothetical protein
VQRASFQSELLGAQRAEARWVPSAPALIALLCVPVAENKAALSVIFDEEHKARE